MMNFPKSFHWHCRDFILTRHPIYTLYKPYISPICLHAPNAFPKLTCNFKYTFVIRFPFKLYGVFCVHVDWLRGLNSYRRNLLRTKWAEWSNHPNFLAASTFSKSPARRTYWPRLDAIFLKLCKPFRLFHNISNGGSRVLWYNKSHAHGFRNINQGYGLWTVYRRR